MSQPLYAAVVHTDQHQTHAGETSGFGVSFLDLPGCFGAGPTLESALKNAAEAARAHLDFLRDEGEPIPTPRGLSAVLSDPDLAAARADGAVVLIAPVPPQSRAIKFSLSMDEALLARVDAAARAAGTTRSGLLAEAARRQFGL